MSKRSIYLQPSDHLYRRTRRDLEFLCNYWDRLITSNPTYDIRLPELLRANHLMRHLSSLSLPSNQGLRVNVSFTILDDSNCLEPEETYQLGNALPNCTESRNGFHRSSCNSNATRYNNLLRNYIRQINENYIAIERELMRARLLAPLERNIFAGCQNAFYNQCAATCNKFPAGNRTYSVRVSPGLHERYVNSQERNNRQTCALFSHKCCIADRKNKEKQGCTINQQSARQKENSPEEFHDSPTSAKQHSLQTSAFCTPIIKKLQPNNNALQNCTRTAPARNNGTIKQQSSKEPMDTCQNVSKIISNAVKISHSAKLRSVKPDDGVVINNNDKRSIDSQPVSYQGNVLLQTAESSVMTDQNEHVTEQGRSSKRKLDDLKGRTIAVELDLKTGSQQDRSRMTERIKSRVNNTPTMFIPDEKARSRIKNGRILMEGKPFWKRHVSTPKYASFLRMFRKEETDNQVRNNSSYRRNKGEKSQYQENSAESSSVQLDNRVNPRIEKRTPTPRSTVHTTYNPIMHSSFTDPTLDSNDLTIQLLRLAVLLYTPTLMPALNSLIAQQNQQTSVSTSAFEDPNDLLIQIFRLLNEQQSIPNLPFVSIESERVSPDLTAQTNGESSRSLSEEKEGNNSTATKKSDPVSEQKSNSAGNSGWKLSNHVQQQNGKNRKWQLTSMLTDSDVRLNGNLFTAENFRKLEEFLKVKKKRSEDIRSLSTKSTNEIAMKEYFRKWLHQLLQQLNSASNNLSVNDEERGCPEGSSRIADESSLEEIEGQRSRDRSVLDESSDFSRDDGNTFTTEREEKDSDDQKFTSVTSTNSSRSWFEQDDAIAAEKEEKLSQNENLQD